MPAVFDAPRPGDLRIRLFGPFPRRPFAALCGKRIDQLSIGRLIVRSFFFVPRFLLVTVLWLCVPLSVSAQSLEELAGTWVGDSLRRVKAEGGPAGASGLNAGAVQVVVTPKGKKFTFAWTAFTRDENGALSIVPSGAVFEPTERAGVYRADDIDGKRFDGSESGNPLKGKPMLWARVAGSTLVVQSLVLDERGHFVIDRLELDVIEGEMSLEFLRMDQDVKKLGLRGQLKKKGG